MFSSITSSFSIKLAIDLGTISTLIYEEGRGIIANEPTIIALTKHSGNIVAVGNEALAMLGRAPRDVVHVRPLKDGAIADFDATEKMLRTLIGRVMQGRSWRPFNVAIAIPNQSTPVERRAVRESARKARARNVSMIEEGIAVGWGVGIPVYEPNAGMVIDIGGGTTNITVVASLGIVCSRTLTVAGNQIDEAIIKYIKRGRGMLISERTAEEIKINFGSAMTLDEELSGQIVGKGIIDGAPRAINITSEEIRPAILEIINLIGDEILGVLDYVSPQTLADLFQRGIVITGGSANIRLLDKYLSDRLQLRVFTAEQPMLSVVNGISKIIGNKRLLERVRLNEQKIDLRASEALILGAPY
jgi:rod shape-determining protein MreB